MKTLRPLGIALLVTPAFLLLPAARSAPTAPSLATAKVVDLTHPFDEHTLSWPTSTAFSLTTLSAGQTPGGWFDSSNSFCTPEHGGTHLDAPHHFSEKGSTAERIPLSRRIAPAVVLDVRAKCAADADDRLARPDAAKILVADRRIAALGVDTASVDSGPSKDFPVHRIAGAADVPGFENVANLESVPETGAWIVALPMMIAGGSGGPLRIVALLP